LLKAVIFDMDGVIIDSEPMHARAALLALQKYNSVIGMDYVESFIGSTTYHMCQRMVEDFHLSVTPEELLNANEEMKKYLLKTEGHTVVPYVIDMIKDLHHNKIKLSIASSSSVKEIEEVMDTLDIRKYFDGFVSGTSVAHTKPAPDIFLKAAEELGVTPYECIIIEDSYNGVTAAHAAKITCVGFVNPNSGNQDLQQADLLVEGFDEVNYDFLNQFYEIIHPTAILTTRQFIIRELEISDIPDLFRISIQPEVREFIEDFSDDLKIEEEKHSAYIKNIYRYYGYGIWGVFLKETGQLIGRCGIERKMFDTEEIYELGYLLRKEYQGLGYASQFVRDVLNYCFTALEIPKITAIIDKNNSKSIHLAERVGMQRIKECIRNNKVCYIYEIEPKK
jgi:beta-phosphoglucomutase family hydrolase